MILKGGTIPGNPRHTSSLLQRNDPLKACFPKRSFLAHEDGKEYAGHTSRKPPTLKNPAKPQGESSQRFDRRPERETSTAKPGRTGVLRPPLHRHTRDQSDQNKLRASRPEHRRRSNRRRYRRPETHPRPQQLQQQTIHRQSIPDLDRHGKRRSLLAAQNKAGYSTIKVKVKLIQQGRIHS